MEGGQRCSRRKHESGLGDRRGSLAQSGWVTAWLLGSLCPLNDSIMMLEWKVLQLFSSQTSCHEDNKKMTTQPFSPTVADTLLRIWASDFLNRLLSGQSPLLICPFFCSDGHTVTPYFKPPLHLHLTPDAHAPDWPLSSSFLPFVVHYLLIFSLPMVTGHSTPWGGLVP